MPENETQCKKHRKLSLIEQNKRQTTVINRNKRSIQRFNRLTHTIREMVEKNDNKN